MKSIWQDWRSAMQFLTTMPMGGAGVEFHAARTLPFFPLCGLFIGLAAGLVDAAAGLLWMPAASSLLVVGFLVLITGALHLDGIADTADGLYGQRTPENALTIMKDSRIGAMGAVAITVCLAVKWVGIGGLDHQRFWCLTLVPAYARSGVLWAIKYLPYGRPEGTGHGFFSAPLAWRNFWGLGLVVALSLALGWKMVVVINIGFGLMVICCLMYYRRKMGCITGDMQGAMIEAIEAGLFFMLSALSAGGIWR
jgi:adenosylcobinamide-GDP ribazoletransferase